MEQSPMGTMTHPPSLICSQRVLPRPNSGFAAGAVDCAKAGEAKIANVMNISALRWLSFDFINIESAVCSLLAFYLFQLGLRNGRFGRFRKHCHQVVK